MAYETILLRTRLASSENDLSGLSNRQIILDEKSTLGKTIVVKDTSGGILEYLNSTTLGSTSNGKGSSLVGVSAISGISGNNVQTVLENLKTYSDNTYLPQSYLTQSGSSNEATKIMSSAAVQIAIQAAALKKSYQEDVLAVQTDNTLDPGATPTLGDRYVITNSASLHANFGTISGLGDNDIVEYDGTDFVVSYDVSVVGEGALAWNRSQDKWESWTGTSWQELGGLATITAGEGLGKIGNTVYVNVDTTTNTTQINGSDQVAVKYQTTKGLNSDASGMLVKVDTTTTQYDGSGNVSVKVGNGLQAGVSGVEVKSNSDAITVGSSGVAVATASGSPITTTGGLGLSVTDPIQVTGSSVGLKIDSTLEVSTGNLRVKPSATNQSLYYTNGSSAGWLSPGTENQLLYVTAGGNLGWLDQSALAPLVDDVTIEDNGSVGLRVKGHTSTGVMLTTTGGQPAVWGAMPLTSSYVSGQLPLGLGGTGADLSTLGSGDDGKIIYYDHANTKLAAKSVIDGGTF